MKKILILSANPINTDRLRLDEEVREIEESWERSKYRSQFEVFTRWAVRIDDLRHALLDKEPQIVHFSGHGMRTGGVGLNNNRENTLPLREAVRLHSQPSGIALEDDFGRMQLVSTEALTDLFELFKDKVECVLLNACYSETQAKAIHQHIDCVIGMTQSIPDRTAINFSKAFYEAIFAGRNYEDGFKFGSNNIDLHNSSEFYPKFHNRPNYKTLSAQNQTNNQPSNLLEQPTSNTATPATQEDYKQRKVLLNKVKNYWIEGVLEKSLHTRVMIELNMEERLDAVEHLGIEELDQSKQALLKGTGVTDVFSRMGEGRTLLILGEPGAGKTTTLLTLTKHLIISTEQDLSRQIPVVFNLSSWANKQQKIAEWLVQQLYEKYHVPKAKGKAWVEKEQLLLLLDGLDEVKAERREACVQALNQFIRDHGLTEMVVTSRIGDYTALRASLILQKAICIQSLTPEQINQYLDSADEQLKALKTLLAQDTALQELAKSPLTLGIMTLAYEGVSIEDLPNTNSTEERIKHLFNAYIERMLNRRITVQQYSTSRTIRWLTWLAQRMLQHSQTIFLIEQIQPSWLPTKLARRIYSLGISLFSNLLLLPVFALIPSAISPYILIIIIGLLLWSFFKPSKQEIKPVETLKWEWRNSTALFSALSIGLPIALTVGANASPMVALIAGVIAGIIAWLIFGLTGSEIETKAYPNQGIHKSAIYFGIFVLIASLIFGLIANLTDERSSGLFGELIYTLALPLNLGGQACIQHLILRLMLYRNNYIPWNYARFLDYATERIFLQKVGGGYIFIHRLLLEHFAQMELE